MLIISSLVTTLIVFRVIKVALSLKTKKKEIALLFSALIVLYLAALYLFPTQASVEFIVIINIIITLTAPLFIFKGSVKSHTVYLAAFVLGLFYALYGTVSWIVGIDITVLINAQAVEIVSCLVFTAACIIATRKGVMSRVLNSILLLQKFMKIVLLITIWLTAFLSILFSFLLSIYTELSGFILLGTVIAIFILLVGVMCPLLILNNLSNVHFKNLSDAMDRQIDAQVSHYETVIRMHEDLQRFQHDYKNLQVALRSLLTDSDIEGALKFLNSDEMSIHINRSKFKTGNIILDALLGEKQLIADTVNTTIRFEGVLPGSLISTADICIIFGNTLDNAIEACAEIIGSEENIISVSSVSLRNFLFIKIKNPVIKNVHITNSSIATTKTDKQSHGIGLRSVQKIVKKHSGKMILSCDDNTFCIEIDFNFNQPE